MIYTNQEKVVDTTIDGSLVILGKPTPQKRHRYSFRGGNVRNFKAKALEFSPKKMLKGAIMLSITFYMPRPKNHYRTGKFSHLLKNNAPISHIVKPDIDNLSKFVMDALQGILWDDDCYINALEARKAYSEKPRTEIEYWQTKERKNK